MLDLEQDVLSTTDTWRHGYEKTDARRDGSMDTKRQKAAPPTAHQDRCTSNKLAKCTSKKCTATHALSSMFYLARCAREEDCLLCQQDASAHDVAYCIGGPKLFARERAGVLPAVCMVTVTAGIPPAATHLLLCMSILCQTVFSQYI